MNTASACDETRVASRLRFTVHGSRLTAPPCGSPASGGAGATAVKREALWSAQACLRFPAREPCSRDVGASIAPHVQMRGETRRGSTNRGLCTVNSSRSDSAESRELTAESLERSSTPRRDHERSCM